MTRKERKEFNKMCRKLIKQKKTTNPYWNCTYGVAAFTPKQMKKLFREIIK